MIQSPVRAIVHNGQIEVLDGVKIPEGTELLLTPVSEDSSFWMRASEGALRKVWDNPEDDVYAELLKE